MPIPEAAIFLGAGASCGEGAPDQANMFKAFFSESFDDYSQVAAGRASPASIKVLKNQLVRFFQIFFGINPELPGVSIVLPTFEEALGVLDLALSRDDGFRGFEGNLHTEQRGATLRNVRRGFVFLIALTLDKTLEKPKGHHATLIRNLNRLGLLNQCAFVSFNYDILIDNALADLQGHELLEYGIEFTNFHTEHTPTQREIVRVPLLKLHGSLNWLYCPTCHSVTLTEFRKGVCDLIVDPNACCCEKCGSLSAPIIVPPTYFKVFANLFLQNVWHRAEQILSSCRTWVFCGYSFPDADMHVKYLLKRIQVNSPRLLRVVIINWYSEKDLRQAHDEEQRFVRFMGNNIRLKYEKMSFEQFANDPIKVF